MYILMKLLFIQNSVRFKIQYAGYDIMNVMAFLFLATMLLVMTAVAAHGIFTDPGRRLYWSLVTFFISSLALLVLYTVRVILYSMNKELHILIGDSQIVNIDGVVVAICKGVSNGYDEADTLRIQLSNRISAVREAAWRFNRER